MEATQIKQVKVTGYLNGFHTMMQEVSDLIKDGYQIVPDHLETRNFGVFLSVVLEKETLGIHLVTGDNDQNSVTENTSAENEVPMDNNQDTEVTATETAAETPAKRGRKKSV